MYKRQDCCCGTGTIPKEAIQIKKTQMTAKEAVETVWACDKNNYPLQVANISMTEPDTINTVSYTHLDVYKRQPLKSIA